MENILTVQETTVLFARHTIHSDFPWVNYTLTKLLQGRPPQKSEWVAVSKNKTAMIN